MSHFTSAGPEAGGTMDFGDAANLDDLEDLLGLFTFSIVCLHFFFLFYITICLYFPIIGQLAEDEVQNLLDEMASDPDDVHLPASVRNSYRYSTTTFTKFVYNVCLLFPGFCLHYFCLLLTPIDATRPPPVL